MEYLENLYRANVGGTQMGDLRLYCCGRRLEWPNHSFGPAARSNFWIVYLREGTGIVEENGVQYPVEAGMFFILYPNRRVHYRADPGSIWSIHWMNIGAAFLEKYLLTMGITEKNPVVRAKDPAATIEAYEALLNLVLEETVAAKFGCISLVYRLLALMTPNELEAPVSRDYVDEAIFYMLNNYEDPISIADVAAAIRLDPSYFARLFSQRMGVTPSQWLNEYRLKKSCSLLTGTDLKVNEIALSVGFTDPLYFSRRFHRQYGISPSTWRTKNA